MSKSGINASRSSGFPSGAPAFSLLELLLAMTIVAGLVTASLAAYASIARAAALGTGADQLSDLLAEARSDATTQNLTVEVRLYDLPGSADPMPAYRAAQLHWLEADGTKPAIAAPLFLPASVVLDPTATRSSLIGANTIAAAPDPADPRLNGQTRVFHFLPDGSTDLAPGSAWFLTLRAATASDPNHFPPDWASITVDPTTGRTQIFRP
jgi:uncharacterized protein (TIGR02596 family)